MHCNIKNNHFYMIYFYKCYASFIMISLSSINTHQRERQTEFTNKRDIIMCDTICVVDG